MSCEAHLGLHLEVHFKVFPLTPPHHFRYLIQQYFYSVNVRTANSGMFHFRCCIILKYGPFKSRVRILQYRLVFLYNFFLNPSELRTVCLFGNTVLIAAYRCFILIITVLENLLQLVTSCIYIFYLACWKGKMKMTKESNLWTTCIFN